MSDLKREARSDSWLTIRDRIELLEALGLRLYISADGELRARKSASVFAMARPILRLRRAEVTVFDFILRLKHRAQLSEAKIDSLQSMKRAYIAYRDSAFSKLAAVVIANRSDLTGRVVRNEWHADLAAVERWLYHNWPRVRRLLSDHQYSVIPESMLAVQELSPAAFQWWMLARD